MEASRPLICWHCTIVEVPPVSNLLSDPKDICIACPCVLRLLPPCPQRCLSLCVALNRLISLPLSIPEPRPESVSLPLQLLYLICLTLADLPELNQLILLWIPTLCLGLWLYLYRCLPLYRYLYWCLYGYLSLCMPLSLHLSLSLSLPGILCCWYL